MRLDPAGTAAQQGAGDGAEQPTVQTLLQEREITYRNLLAAYLRLQEVNRQKTVFLASAAHELKTPLAVMKGYYDLLAFGLAGKAERKAAGHSAGVEGKLRAAGAAGIHVPELFGAGERKARAASPRKRSARLRDRAGHPLAGGVPAQARAAGNAARRDSFRLSSSIIRKCSSRVANLLDNALKHTPAGGSVTLRAEPHFWERRSTGSAVDATGGASAAANTNSVRVSVTDTGPGIAAEHHQEIFEDFVRVDRTSSGMGLGLAIAKRLVQAHRGKIWVDSEPRRGSTFTFLLPTDNQ